MMKNKWKITAAAILGTAGILTAGYLYWCTTMDDKVIWKDVSINWVALQGKTMRKLQKKQYRSNSKKIIRILRSPYPLQKKTMK